MAVTTPQGNQRLAELLKPDLKSTPIAQRHPVRAVKQSATTPARRAPDLSRGLKSALRVILRQQAIKSEP